MCITTTIFGSIVTTTDVYTPGGIVLVDDLRVEDTLVSWSPEQGIGATRITHITEKEVAAIIFIETEHGELYASEDQLLFDPKHSAWIKARDLTVDNFLLSYHHGKSRCHAFKRLEGRAKIYEISTEFPHTFFVGEAGFLTHNEPFMIVIGGSLAFDSVVAGIAWLGAGLGVGVAGAGFYGWLTRRDGMPEEKNSHSSQPQKPACGDEYEIQITTRFEKTPPQKPGVDDKNQGKQPPVQDAQAPGKPTENDGYKPPKNWDGEKGAKSQRTRIWLA